jgi:5-methylcytosine-specific restriction endonuclease McrA
MSKSVKKITPASATSSLVARSKVTPGLPYREYREDLREDFTYSCAYCTISEFEAQAIRMVIDHYEPRVARPDLENIYDNLMYSCDDCNMLKGDRSPPQAARVDGRRFFRPDQEYRHEHFQEKAVNSDIHLQGLTTIGEFTVEFTDLNRPTLLRLRKIRKNLANCHEYVLHGVLGLKHFPIDRLPKEFRAAALKRIRQWEGMSKKIADDVDAVLRGIAYSPMIDRDPNKEMRAEERAAEQKFGSSLSG